MVNPSSFRCRLGCWATGLTIDGILISPVASGFRLLHCPRSKETRHTRVQTAPCLWVHMSRESAVIEVARHDSARQRSRNHVRTGRLPHSYQKGNRKFACNRRESPARRDAQELRAPLV